MKSLTAAVWIVAVCTLALLLNAIPPVHDAVWNSYYQAQEIEGPDVEPVSVRLVQGEPLPVTLVSSEVSLKVRPDHPLQGFPVEIQSVRNCQMEGFTVLSAFPCIGVIIGE
jgi:hypothetical protein